MKKTILICFLFLVNASTVFSQIGKYLVLFKDKNNNTYSVSSPLAFVNQRSIDRRNAQGIAFSTNDLPPTKSYVDGLKAAGATVWYTSRWLNAALVLMDPTTASTVLNLPYVKGFENNGPMDLKANGLPGARIENKFDIELEIINHGNATTQVNMLGLQHLHNASFKGEGKLIAVLDDGFNSINQDAYLASLFTENRIIDHFDFVRNLAAVYDVGGHGNLVLSTMAANVPGAFVGTAPQAKYALFRSENAPDERILEEANYLFAAERADSVGADIINSSLGYTTYDYSGYSHTSSDYNGDKILVTRAADWAARAGILVCTSAGNDGLAGIGAPADGDSILAVGAVTSAEIKSSFSSVGPSADLRIKPDISAMGSSATVSRFSGGVTQLLTANGTSFSSPISAGFAACFWQANSEMNQMQILTAIKNIGTLSANPNNNLGWGIPKFHDITIALDLDSKIKNIQPNIQNSFLGANNTRIIAQLFPNGANPVNGNVEAKVFVDLSTEIVNGMPTLQRHYEIKPSNSPEIASSEITLFLTQGEINLYNANNGNYADLVIGLDNSITNLRILHAHELLDNSIAYEIIDPLDSKIKWNSIENFWEVSFDNQGFSSFYITSIANAPLPIELGSFNAKHILEGNLLEWETKSEINNSHFEVQKSSDSFTFFTIGKVNKQLQNNETKNYKFLDTSILDNSLVYYRLKNIDLNGKFTYSKIIALKNENVRFVKILSNPFTNELEMWIDDSLKDGFQLEIHDILGKNILQKQYELDTNLLKINTLNWPNGEYYLNFLKSNSNYSYKILKR